MSVVERPTVPVLTRRLEQAQLTQQAHDRDPRLRLDPRSRMRLGLAVSVGRREPLAAEQLAGLRRADPLLGSTGSAVRGQAGRRAGMS